MKLLLNFLLCICLFHFSKAFAETTGAGGNSGGADPQMTSSTSAEGEEMGDSEEGTDQTQESEKSAAHHRRRPRNTHCTTTYGNVKRYLTENKIIEKHLAGRCAWQAAYILPRSGFKKTSSTVQTAKKDEVCVFDTGSFVCEGKPVGTIAVKTDKGWFNGCSENPEKWLGSLPLVGCFKKSGK